MSYLDYVVSTYRDTFIMFILGAIGVALVMRITKHAFFDKIEEWVNRKSSEGTEKAEAVFSTVKSTLCTVFSAFLSFSVIWCLMHFLKFPAENNKALIPFYFVPFYFLQLFLDLKGLKFMTNKLFGIDVKKKDEDEADNEPEEEKVKIIKVKGRKYTEGEDGILVPVEG
ncbi:MAG: hypothetical protein ACTTJW_08505 [Sphaerochaeta sp.]